MNSLINKENGYVAELKSLLEDKFFMLLLGISVSIVILSSVYSIIRPKDGQTVATNTKQSQNQSESDNSETSNIEGIDDNNQNKSSTDVLGEIKKMLNEDKVLSATVAPTQTPVANVSKGQSSEYIVKQGDNLWSIAESTRGSGYVYAEIAKLNNITNSDYIEVGQKLTLGTSQVKSESKGVITEKAAMTKRTDNVPQTYTVKTGDSLWTISEQVLNNGYEWSKIATQNNIYTPDLIYPGQVIQLK